MSFIDIHTNNLSRELRTTTTFLDNWVYIPGTAITGDYTRPYAITSLDDFKSTFGDHSPEGGSITYEYVSGILNAGLPVIFRRIACVGQDTNAAVPGVTKASTVLTHNASDTEEIQDIRITEKFGGTYGNGINITVRYTGVSYWIDVYYKFTLLEQVKLLTVNNGDTSAETNRKLIQALKAATFDRIDIEVLEEDPTKFNLDYNVERKYLTGGTDFNEDLVVAEIPRSFEAISDKILFSPKFLTSGGYTESNTQFPTEQPIAKAMLNLTMQRQDCRALIDLPVGTSAERQQEFANLISYRQNESTEVIPSASICAPWVWMQVGSTQAWMPPSYAFLTTVGNSIKVGGQPYTPKAGVATGQVDNIIRPEFEVGAQLSEQWQRDEVVNINPIMRLNGGRYIIAGNSTLLVPQSPEQNNAFVESSADLAVIEIRRYVYNISQELQYQYNTTEAFETFSLSVSKFLNTMRSHGGVMDYNIENISTADEPRKLKIRLDVYLTPTIKKIEIFLNVAYGNIEISTGGEE